jgi:hypothetical protein
MLCYVEARDTSRVNLLNDITLLLLVMMWEPERVGSALD